jgi:hypothetical protein
MDIFEAPPRPEWRNLHTLQPLPISFFPNDFIIFPLDSITTHQAAKV